MASSSIHQNGCQSGNQTESSGDCSTKSKLSDSKSSSVQDRLLFHDKLNRLSRCDLETPASIVANVNIKQLLTPAAFDHLPTKYQNELIKLLPETDRIPLDSRKIPFAMTVNALSNEFFAKSCVEYRDRLRNGEFCVSSASSRTDIDPVIWECDSHVLKEYPPKDDIPKAGDPFICTSKEPQHRLMKKTRSGNIDPRKVSVSVTKLQKSMINPPKSSSSSADNSKSLLKSSTKTISRSVTKTISPSAALAKLAVSKAKAQAVSSSNNRSKHKEPEPRSLLTGVKRPRPPEPSTTTTSTKTPATTNAAVSTSATSIKEANTSTNSSPKQNSVVITKFQKVTENGTSGEKVTKVVPVVVRNPHGQVVTTLANCNPLLTQMIKNPVNSQTPTAAPAKKAKTAQSLLPTILKRSNKPVVVTLRKNPNMLPNKNGVSKAVNEVISKVRSTANGSKPSPVIVTVSSNGSVTSKIIPKSVNLQRSKQICDSSKPGSQTLDLERSYEICKQVLGKSVEGATIVVVGPGGKRKIISNKPVRNRHLLDTATAASNNSLCSSDIPVYRNKHRNGKSTLTLSGHVFLALNRDEEGYAAKAYKRKTAFRLKHKKKLSKLPANKKLSNQLSVSGSSSSTTTAVSVSSDTTLSLESRSDTSISGSVTAVTDSIYATQPVLSVTENKTNIMNGVSSLLNSCMCSQRALIICSNCGAFCHSECGSKDLCLACC